MLKQTYRAGHKVLSKGFGLILLKKRKEKKLS